MGIDLDKLSSELNTNSPLIIAGPCSAESQQQLFIASFYSYLNYHKTDDYVVDLDNIWKWLDFNRKYNIDHMVKGDVIFCATGVTNGCLLYTSPSPRD